MDEIVDHAKYLKLLVQKVGRSLDKQDWQILAMYLPGGEIIKEHGRLLQSLYFGDDDYDSCVVEVLNALYGIDPDNLGRIEGYIDDDANPKNSPELTDNIFEDVFCIFISHKSEEKQLASLLQQSFIKYGIDSFVAHEDIEPTKPWCDEIERYLNTCHAFVYLSSKNSNSSEWCQQEIGWAMGRSIPVISLTIDQPPKAFLGFQQGYPFNKRRIYVSALKVIEILLGKQQTSLHMSNTLITALRNARCYDDASDIANAIKLLPLISVSQAEKLEECIAENRQVSEANFGRLPQTIRELIKEKGCKRNHGDGI